MNDDDYIITLQPDGESYVVMHRWEPERSYLVTIGRRGECDCPHWITAIRWPGDECKHHRLIHRGVPWNLDEQEDFRWVCEKIFAHARKF